MRHRDTEARRILGFLCAWQALSTVAMAYSSGGNGPCEWGREPSDRAWSPVPLTECFMDAIAKIGPSIRIKGDITANEPLTIAGQVDGTIDVKGHALTVTQEAHLNATVTAETIVVGGRVKGKMLGGARIVVGNTATIEGDLSAPAISLADGATLHGRVETTARRAAKLQLAS